jgi:hypothetical protein
MERFAQYVVAGGLTLVAGLWTAEFAPGSVPRLAALAVAAAGAAIVLGGIHRELDY